MMTIIYKTNNYEHFAGRTANYDQTGEQSALRTSSVFCHPFLSSSRYLLMTLALGCSSGLADQPASLSVITEKHQAAPLSVQDITTAGGIKAWMVEAREIPVVSVSLAFRNAGFASDPQNMTGLVNLLSGMLDEGAGEWDSQAFKKFLLEKNIQFSVSANQDTFQIRFRTVKENIREAFLVLRTILMEPRFDKNALSRIKNQILTMLEQSLHDEHSIASKKLNAQIYGNHPYGKTPEQALKEFPKVTEADLRTFMKNRFVKDQLLVAVVGDISQKDAKEFLNETFGSLPEKLAGVIVQDAPLQNLGTTSVIPLDIPQSIIYFAQPGVARDHPGFYAAMVMMEIVGDGQFESRLWNEIREKRGLAYGVDASLTWNQHSSIVLGGTATKNASVDEVIKIIKAVWKSTLEGITQEELDFVKERMKGSFALNFSSTNKIAGALLSYLIDNLPINYINERNKIISSLTLEQINHAAQSVLKPDQLTFVVVGKPDLVTDAQHSSLKTSGLPA